MYHRLNNALRHKETKETFFYNFSAPLRFFSLFCSLTRVLLLIRLKTVHSTLAIYIILLSLPSTPTIAIDFDAVYCTQQSNSSMCALSIIVYIISMPFRLMKLKTPCDMLSLVSFIHSIFCMFRFGLFGI